jgi:hypothetical protein
LLVSIEEKSKCAQSQLTKHESEKHVEQLLQFIKKSKPYLEPSLSLTELAANLDIHPRYLSQEINPCQSSSLKTCAINRNKLSW